MGYWGVVYVYILLNHSLMLLRGWLFTLPNMVAIAELCATPCSNATELSYPMLPAGESKFKKSCPKS